jgi:hypothetical protein
MLLKYRLTTLRVADDENLGVVGGVALQHVEGEGQARGGRAAYSENNNTGTRFKLHVINLGRGEAVQ